MTTIYVNKGTALPKRKENDLYQTEPNLIRAAIQKFVLDPETGVHPRSIYKILDIGAYDGRWGTIAAEMLPNDSVVAGVELLNMPAPKTFEFWLAGKSYLDPEVIKRIDDAWPYGFDLIVSNPPYYLAEPIIRQAWKHLGDGGRMIMLLRLSFQSGVDRYNKLWDELPLRWMGVLSRRPSFYGGGTNGTDYGLFVWEKGFVKDQPSGTSRSWPTVLVNYERDRTRRI